MPRGSAGMSGVIIGYSAGMSSQRFSVIERYGSCSLWPCDTMILLAATTRETPASRQASKML
jgi:hypothetical protein